jgi:hypothetical protein
VSTKKNEVSIAPAVEPPATSYHEAAQSLVEELHRMRERIPHFVVPTVKGGRRSLSTISSLSPQFVELTALARANFAALARGEGTTPAESRDLMAYADAFAPFADELEALAQFVRFSTSAAKFKAGDEALMTYALARRLVRRAEHAGLAPHVADMRRAFGKRGKRAQTDAPKTQPDAETTPQAPQSEKK